MADGLNPISDPNLHREVCSLVAVAGIGVVAVTDW
jgi:hypothetical protein